MLEQKVLDYIEEHAEEARELLITLAQIPSPSNHEEKRAEFCKKWLEAQGAEGVFIDEALNVIYPIAVTKDNPVVVFMAHTDVVFPDMEALPLTTENGRIYCPGVGDDTANLVSLLMVAKYLAETGLAQKLEVAVATGDQPYGLVLVCNSGEEGLGNLKGSRKICQSYGSRIKEFYSFDGGLTSLSTHAVGSKRFKIKIHTIGGHSYSAFGNPNAIAQMAELIHELYHVQVPLEGKTTYNVGMISGGTSVNTIAQYGELLYEFRSDSREGLSFMEQQFETIVDAMKARGIDMEIEVVGLRPCEGDVDKIVRENMIKLASDTVWEYTGQKPTQGPGSTDCNIPLSLGIPALCLGTYRGSGAHTREEYVEIDSLLSGYKVGFQMILNYCNVL